jgi:hypothetical protein
MQKVDAVVCKDVEERAFRGVPNLPIRFRVDGKKHDAVIWTSVRTLASGRSRNK